MESPKTEEQLQRLFDGELAPEDEAAVRRELEGSEEGVEALRQWARLREAMQAASTEWAGQLDSEGLFARIQSEIATASPEPSVSEERETAPPTPVIPLRPVPDRRERRIWAAVATGLAAAAAVSLAVISWPEGSVGPTGAVRGSEVVEADFGNNTGTIFEVEGGAGESLAVVWIDEEEVAIP